MLSQKLAVNSSERTAAIKSLWEARQPIVLGNINSGLAAGSSQCLYDAQQELSLLVDWCEKKGEKAVLGEIFEITAFATEHCRSVGSLKVDMGGYVDTLHFGTKTPVWPCVNAKSGAPATESILNSAQFLYLATRVLTATAQTGAKVDEKRLKKMVKVVSAHYLRWVLSPEGCFEVRAWGCDSERFNHLDFTKKKYSDPFSARSGGKVSYCNAVTDTDLWIYAGVVELLAFLKKSTTAFGMERAESNALLDYAQLSCQLLNSRVTHSAGAKTRENNAQACDFDPGSWDDHPTYAYAGISTRAAPDMAAPKKSKNVSWDIGHSFRFVQVFETFARHQGLLGLSFPEKGMLACFANQFAQKIFNGDLDRPLFANYFNGENGWYRFDDSGRGYGPFQQSEAFFYGGYGFWAKYCPEIGKIEDNLLRLATSKNAEDRKFCAQFYPNLIPADPREKAHAANAQWFWLPFLTAMALHRD